MIALLNSVTPGTAIRAGSGSRPTHTRLRLLFDASHSLSVNVVKVALLAKAVCPQFRWGDRSPGKLLLVPGPLLLA